MLGRRFFLGLAVVAAVCGALAAMYRDLPRSSPHEQLIEKLRPLHTRLGPPQPGDWLDQHKEDGQTFAQYIASRPVRPQGKRKVIYIQPLGDFTDTQRKIVTLTADFLGRYFNVPVKIQRDLPLRLIPQQAQRVHPTWGMPQILTTYVLDEVLCPRLPPDAAAYIAFTASDLWPGEGWNFVFGQASLRDRVGVWSIYRNGDPDESPDAFRLCLLRTLKTASHETGHMFSMKHCTLYECNMCGSNHREESDRRPLTLCPECVAKVCWATTADPIKRYESLEAFCREQGLKEEAAFYRQSADTLRAAK
jgi:archaemetzincin